MTYAYDDWVQMPTMSIYDKDIMKMSIDNARYMYEKGQSAIEKFEKQYSDFMSPFAKDMARYGEMMDGVRGMINDAYAHGVDLTKTPEGRAMISRAIGSIDPAEYNAMRANAKLGYAYLDSAQKLNAQGKYSQALEDWISSQSGNVSFNDFSTAENGTWNRMPMEYSSLQEMVHPSFAGIKPHLLTEAEARSRVGDAYDPRAEYTGVTRADMEQSMRAALPGLIGTPMYGFYREQARKDLIAQGITNPTDEQINDRFVQNAITADSQVMTPLSSDMRNWYDQQKLDISKQQLELTAQRNQILAEAKTQKPNAKNTSPSEGKTPVSYYEPLYQNLVINTLNNDPYMTEKYGNKEFSLGLGEQLYASQQNIADEYFGDGTGKSIYGVKTSVKSRSILPQLKYEPDGSGGGTFSTTRGSGKSVYETSFPKQVSTDLSNTDTFKRRFNNSYNNYLERMSMQYEPAIFADSWNFGQSKVSEVTESGRTIERLRGQNYVYIGKEDIDRIYSGKELAARAAGITGQILEDGIKETKRIRNQLRGSGAIMRGANKMLGAGMSDTGQYGMYAKINTALYDGSKLSEGSDAYIMTPFQSTPNPSFGNSGAFNLDFDQSMDLSRGVMDNPVIRKMGVSSNSGTIDNTIPDPTPWYTMGGIDSLGWINDDIE